jgi:hypothetical protein
LCPSETTTTRSIEAFSSFALLEKENGARRVGGGDPHTERRRSTALQVAAAACSLYFFISRFMQALRLPPLSLHTFAALFMRAWDAF